MKILLNLSVLLCFTSFLQAQNVIRKVSAYVLLDTDAGIGRIGESIDIYRKSGGQSFVVGKIKLVLFKNNLAAGKIIEEVAPYKIRINDYVHATKLAKASRQWPVAVRSEMPVINVVMEWVLLNGDLGYGAIGQRYAVYRKGRSGNVKVGSMEIVRIKNGRTICKIIKQNRSKPIRKSDFVLLEDVDGSDDLDYYFFGEFEGK
ncbi:hypothetical protein KAR48_18675 [bacterium]|nr:hypothetical protein [bacterium]